jgi:O-antigen biosynthesis protein
LIRRRAVAAGASNILQVDGAVGTGNTFAFLGPNGDLGLGTDAGFNSVISGLNVGVAGPKTNFIDIEGDTVAIQTVSGQGTTSGSITLSDGAVLQLTGLNSTAWFANTVGDGAGGTDIFVSDVCFCRGTLILTEEREVAVEALAVGDRVRTLSGALKRVVWIGFGRDLVTRANRLARPIVVRRGALADDVPRRDQKHAMRYPIAAALAKAA